MKDQLFFILWFSYLIIFMAWIFMMATNLNLAQFLMGLFELIGLAVSMVLVLRSQDE
jgi:hypothetical protein